MSIGVHISLWVIVIVFIRYISRSRTDRLCCCCLHSRVQFFATPWIAARQASLYFTISWSLLKLMSIEFVISFSFVPFSSCLQFFTTSESSLMNRHLTSGDQSFGASPSASVFSMNNQDWSPLGWTGWISLQSKGLSRVFSNTTVQKPQFFGAQLSL